MRWCYSSRIRLLLATLSLLLVHVLPAQAGPRVALFGFNDNAGLYGQADPAAAASAAQAAGATSVRLTVDWRTVEPVRGRRDFSRYDQLYAAAVARGQRPLFVILFAPPWARSPAACPLFGDCTAPPDPSHDGDFGAFAAAVATRYPQAAGIEVWNEPNLRIFWGGRPVDPARYTRLVKATYAAVKAAAPSVPVISGGLTPYGGEDGTRRGMGVRQFIDGMYAAGAKGAYDGYGVHAYTSLDLWYGFRALTLIKESMADHGDPAKLWLTELNVSTTGPDAVGADDQGRYLRRLVPRLRSLADVGGVWIHTLYEPSWVEAGSTDRGYGLLTAAAQPKPAYCVLAALYAAKLCPTPRPDPAQQARWTAGVKLQAAAEAAIRHRAATGTYAGLTSAVLHGLDPTISARPPSGAAWPSRIAVVRASDSKGLLLCNASRAGRTYCIASPSDGTWIYGSGTGDIDATARATDAGTTSSW